MCNDWIDLHYFVICRVVTFSGCSILTRIVPYLAGTISAYSDHYIIIDLIDLIDH